MIDKLTLNGRLMIVIVSTSLTLISSTTAWADTIKSVSVSRTIEGPPEFFEASVRCNRYRKAILMRKMGPDDKWCSVDVPSECHKKKLSLSRRLCADKFISKLQNLNSNGANEQASPKQVAAVTPSNVIDSKTTLLEEQNQIAEELLIIRNKREELKKRADDLKKSQ